MKKMFYCLAMIGLFSVSSCRSIQQSEGIGQADSIHVEYCGMGGTIRYVIDHSDTLTILDGVFFHDSLGNDCSHLFEPVRKVASDDVPVIQRLARQLLWNAQSQILCGQNPTNMVVLTGPFSLFMCLRKGKKQSIVTIQGRKRMA